MDESPMTQVEIDAELDEIKKEQTPLIEDLLTSIVPFRLLNAAEVVVVEQWVLETYGLRGDQVVVNSWGFPFIPKPEPRTYNGILRTIPDRAEKAIVSHPIYWVEEEVTQRRVIDGEPEGDQEWSLRMFCFLECAGMFTKEHKACDYLELRGIDTDDPEFEANLEAFVGKIGYSSTLDTVPRIGMKDLLVPEEKFEAHFQKVLDKCTGILQSEQQSAFSSIGESLDKAEALAFHPSNGERVRSPFDSDTVWMDKYAARGTKAVNEYRKAVESSAPSTGSYRALEDFTRDVVEECKDMDVTSASIVGPTVAVMSNIDRKDVASILAFQQVANEKAHDRSKGIYDFSDHLSAVLVAEDPDAARLLLTSLMAAYESAWKRLVLAHVNYSRAYEDKPLYESYEVASFKEGF